MLQNRTRPGTVPSVACCPTCGNAVALDAERVVKRGAVIVARDPIVVTWNGHPVPLSPTEAEVYAFVCLRGRVTHQDLDDLLKEIGANPATRSLVLGHIRSKFLRLGACDPFERLGPNTLRLRVDADEAGLTSTVVGLDLPRYATVSR